MYGKTLNGDRIFPIFYTFASKNNSIMKYFEVHFIINNAPEELIQDARDILSALLARLVSKHLRILRRASAAMYSRYCLMKTC